MAEQVEVVIKIPKYYLTHPQDYSCLAECVRRGTPLPKGHGDLIDVNRKITVPVYDEQYEEWGEETLTVREALNRWSDEGITVKDVVILADKAESEDNNGIT